MPKDWCPFDPGSGHVPDDYDVLIYPNDFAAFTPDSEPFSPEPGLFRKTGARGVCDVVLYHPQHNLPPSQMSVEHWGKVAELWRQRFAELARNPDIQYVYIFENTGVAIGVTMPHPHGQIYAFPFVPPFIQTELDSAGEHFRHQKECLYCRILKEELADGRRLVTENAAFVDFVPFFARYPGETQIYSRRHFGSLAEMTEQEISGLAAMIKTMRMKYDSLYGFPMPLMMILRQPPVKGEWPGFHFHIDFYPIQRSATKLKYIAGVESGAGTFLNDTIAEQKAEELRKARPVEDEIQP